MAILKKNYLVEKRNLLNEIRANNMTLQELRFFAIYLSKINARNIETRVVRFPMDDFKAIMELGRIDISYMKNTTNSLLGKVVNVPIKDVYGKFRGYTGFQLFKECTVSKDESGEWYVEIDAHDKALPLMFEFKKEYFSYHVFNALRLRSTNQLRMYELLKQYEKVGSKVFVIEELKQDLWIGKDEYPRYNNFKSKVLDVCQQALKEYTDIKFTYEPYGKKGPGGRIQSLKFYIEKNVNYTDQLTLEMFIDERKTAIDDEQHVYDTFDEFALDPYSERVKLLMGACQNEFTFKQIAVLYNDMQNKVRADLDESPTGYYDYLNDKYQEMQMRNEAKEIKSRYSYLRILIGKD